MTDRPGRLEYTTLIGVPAAVAVVLVAQFLEGAPVKALWQPTAALVVFGGTMAAVFISYPAELVRRTVRAIGSAFVNDISAPEALLQDIVRYAHISRRSGLLGLEPEIEHADNPFMQAALALAADGIHPSTARQILEIESDVRREHDETPAEVLETAAGYAPTLGILGAVLGLIHVMQSLSEPSKLGSGIAVAFVATVYGVGSANLLLLPLATKLRGDARRAALNRDLIVEGITALQEGINPRVVEQRLRGFLILAREADDPRQVA